MSVSKYNSEGYNDPTAYAALTKIHKEEQASKERLDIIYVCSPYAGDVTRNIENARKYSRFVYEKGGIPFAPRLLFPQFMDDSNFTERKTAMRFNRIMLSKCDELWVFGEIISHGMSREIARAKKRDMKVRYFTDECEEVSGNE